MKKILYISLVFCFFSTTGAAITPPSLIRPPIQIIDLSVAEFLRISPREIEKLTGKKLSPGEKISLKILKAKMKKAARNEPGLSVREFLRSTKRKSAGTAILYILLGALLVFFVLFLVLFTDSDR
jgi:hypothetical protein